MAMLNVTLILIKFKTRTVDYQMYFPQTIINKNDVLTFTFALFSCYFGSNRQRNFCLKQCNAEKVFKIFLRKKRYTFFSKFNVLKIINLSIYAQNKTLYFLRAFYQSRHLTIENVTFTIGDIKTNILKVYIHLGSQ